jgi:hypothetical protein
MECNIVSCGSVETPIWNVMREIPPRTSFTYRIFSATVRRRSGMPGRPTQGIELSAGGGWPAAFLAHFGKCVRIAWIEYLRGFVTGSCEKADGMKTYGKSFGRMTGAAACQIATGGNPTMPLSLW